GCHGGRQYRLEQAGQQAEAVQGQRADLLQFGAAGVVLGDQPRRPGGDVAVDQVGDGDETTSHLGELAGVVQRVDAVVVRQQGLPQRRFLRLETVGQPAVEKLLHEAGGAAGDVHPLADQVRVDPFLECLEIEV